MLTPAFYNKHLVDTTTISGPDNINYKSVKSMLNKQEEKTVEFLQEVDPNYLKDLLDEEETTGETTTTTSKKKGARTTTIIADYDMEIVVKQMKKA